MNSTTKLTSPPRYISIVIARPSFSERVSLLSASSVFVTSADIENDKLGTYQ